MNKKKKIIIYSIATFIVAVFCSYIYFSDNIIKNERASINEDKAVYNDGEKSLNEDIVVKLFTEDKKEKEFSIKDFKSEKKIETVTEELLTSELKKDGYLLTKKDENTLTYKRDKKSSLEKDNYYIGADKESIALFKVDEKGNLNLEKNYDYPLIAINEEDAALIKNFDYFHSKDMNEMERKLSEIGVKF